MKNLLVIFAALFVFSLAGCVKNAKVNLPKASPEAAKMAQVVADYVVKNGKLDDVLGCFNQYVLFKDCYTFKIEETDGEDAAEVLLCVEKNKITKKEKILTIQLHSSYKSEGDLKVEEDTYFVDKNVDGKLDYLTSKATLNGELFNEVRYDNGKVEVKGTLPERCSTITPKLIQNIYERILYQLFECIQDKS